MAGNVDQGTGSTQSGNDYQTISGGLNNTTDKDGSTVPGGTGNRALGENASAEGDGTLAQGDEGAHAEGKGTEALGDSSHAEGDSSIARGEHAHVEGHFSSASGRNAHAEGQDARAHGDNSHAEGEDTVAWGLRSHAEGQFCQAFGEGAHAHGAFTFAGANNSTAMGARSVTPRDAQLAIASGLVGAYGMSGQAQCSWLALRGEVTANDDDVNQSTCYLNAYGSAPALGPVEDGKVYSLRVRVTVAGKVSITAAGNYGTPSRNFTPGQRVSATLTRSAHVRKSGGTITVFDTETASPPGTAPAVEVIGDASLGWDIVFDGDYIRLILPTSSADGPPVNVRASALLEFQEILWSDFSPGEISGLTLWLQPSAGWANDTALDTWEDDSPTDKDFVKEADANRPRTFTNVQNGHACVRFNQGGADKQWLKQEAGGTLASLLPTDRDQYTIFIVANLTSTATGEASDVRNNLMMLADNGGRLGFGFRDLTDDTSTISYAQDGGGHVEIPARSPRAVNAALIYTTWHTSTGYLWAQTAGGNGGLDDGVQVNTAVTSPVSGVVRLALNDDGTKNTNMDLFEVLFYDRELSIGERMNVIGYLSEKYNLSTN